MKKTLLTGLTVACLTLLAGQAQAFGHRCCFDYCCPPPCTVKVTYVDKVVTCYKPVWKEEKVKCVVNKMVYREEISRHKCTVYVPKWTEEKRVCRYFVHIPKTVEREVLVCRMVAVQMTDCCGCPYTCYKPETVKQKVKCTVYECKEAKKDIVVKVCNYEPQVKEYKVKHIIPECRQETVDCVRRYCVMTPYQTTIKVAVCVPCCD